MFATRLEKQTIREKEKERKEQQKDLAIYLEISFLIFLAVLPEQEAGLREEPT